MVGNQRNLFVDGTLIADGTPENPIYFTSLRDDIVGGDTNNDSANTVPAVGNWGRIEFRNTSAASLLDNVVIRYAGATDYNSNGSYDWPIYYAAIIVKDAQITLADSVIITNALHGIQTIAVIGTPVVRFRGCNAILSNSQFGLLHGGELGIDALNIWWGSPTGPYHPISNPSGLGNKVSDLVNFVPWHATPCDVPVAPPTALLVTSVTPTQIALAWTDNASDESEYRIERTTTGGDPNWQEIATVGANRTAYADNTLNCSSSLFAYRVRGYVQVTKNTLPTVTLRPAPPCHARQLTSSIHKPSQPPSPLPGRTVHPTKVASQSSARLTTGNVDNDYRSVCQHYDVCR